MNPVLARTRTSPLLHPQELDCGQSFMAEVIGLVCQGQDPSKGDIPLERQEREKEELGLLSFPCLWQAGECQGSRAGTGIALCPRGGGQRSHSPDGAVLPSFAPHHCLPLICSFSVEMILPGHSGVGIAKDRQCRKSCPDPGIG